jgi:hypothetical protein
LSSSTTPSAQHIPFPLSFLTPHLQQASPPLQIEGDFFKKDHASTLSAQLHHSLFILRFTDCHHSLTPNSLNQAFDSILLFILVLYLFDSS